MTDLTLLERWITRRDAEAFRELALRHAGMVYATCRRILRNAADAEDVTQECFEVLARTDRGPVSNLGAWLHRVATHLALNRLKSEGRRVARERVYADRSPLTESIGWDDVYAFVDEAIAELPEELRQAVVAHFLEGRSQTEIATELGVSRQAVQYRVSRGIDRIRQTLRRRGVPVGATTLAVLLAANRAEAAPAAVTCALGKLALTGVGPVGSGTGVAAAIAVGGLTLMFKKAVVGGAIVAALLLAYVFRGSDGEPDPVAPAANPVSTGVPSAERSVPAATVRAVARVNDPGAGSSISSSQAKVLPASVSGRVWDEKHAPIAGANVRLEVARTDDPDGAAAEWEVTTDPAGRYAFGKITVFGRGRLFAVADGFVMERNHHLTVTPSSVHAERDFLLHPSRFFISGTVVDRSGGAVAGATVGVPYYGYTESDLLEITAKTGVTTGSISNSKLVFARTGEDGRFRLALPEEGLCDCMVTKDGFGTALYARVATGTEDNRFVLKSPGAISGTVRDENGVAVPNVQVRAAGGARAGALPPSDVDVQSFRTPILSAVTDEKGRYRVEGLSEDFTYSVEVTHSGEAPTVTSEDGPLAEMILELARDMGDEAVTQAKREGVRVQSGRVTLNVDLVLKGLSETVIFGRVTDRTTGEPVCPVVVSADPLDIWGNNKRPIGFLASTRSDGTYRISRALMDKAEKIALSYRYMTEGGGVAEPVVVSKFRLNPGERKEHDFTVDAPFTAPLRCIDRAGHPVAGLMPGIRKAGGGGGALAGATDAEGRAIKHGLPPGVMLQAIVQVDREDRFLTVGMSEPFTGKPGEVIPEVVIRCVPLGGITGVVLKADGAPLAHARFMYGAVTGEGTPPERLYATTSEDGSFAVADALPEGRYPRIVVGLFSGDDVAVASVEDVEIGAEGMTDLGSVTLRPANEDALVEMLGLR